MRHPKKLLAFSRWSPFPFKACETIWNRKKNQYETRIYVDMSTKTGSEKKKKTKTKKTGDMHLHQPIFSLQSTHNGASVPFTAGSISSFWTSFASNLRSFLGGIPRGPMVQSLLIIQVLHLKGEAVWITNLQPSIAWSQKGGAMCWRFMVK